MPHKSSHTRHLICEFQYSSFSIQYDAAWYSTAARVGLPRSMMTSSNASTFCVTGPVSGEFTGHQWIPRTKASDAELWWSDLRPNKRLGKQSSGWWFETPPAHNDVIVMFTVNKSFNEKTIWLKWDQIFVDLIKIFNSLLRLCLFKKMGESVLRNEGISQSLHHHSLEREMQFKPSNVHWCALLKLHTNRFNHIFHCCLTGTRIVQLSPTSEAALKNIGD